MSNNPKPKDETQASDMFSIDFENGFDGVPGVTQLLNPKLMQEKAAAMKKAKENGAPPPQRVTMSAPSITATPAATPIKEAEISIDFGSDDDHQIVASPTPQHTATPAVQQRETHSPASSEKSLAAMGVQFELQFDMERGVFRYNRMRGHSRASFSLWQEKFYFQMKIDLKVLGVQGSFHEFTKGADTFQEDAFGLTEATHVQVIRIEGNTQKLFVLLSENSLAGSEEKIRDLLSGKGAGNGGSSSGDEDEGFKIELAS